MLKSREWMGVLGFLALVIATIVGLVLTSNPGAAPVVTKNGRNAPAQSAPLVDM